jgi:hypothetical protein
MSTGEPDATEIGHVRFGGEPSEKDQANWHLVGGLPYVTYGVCGSPGGEIPRATRPKIGSSFPHIRSTVQAFSSA